MTKSKIDAHYDAGGDEDMLLPIGRNQGAMGSLKNLCEVRTERTSERRQAFSGELFRVQIVGDDRISQGCESEVPGSYESCAIESGKESLLTESLDRASQLSSTACWTFQRRSIAGSTPNST